VQPENVANSKDVTLDGIVIVVKLRQFENAACLIVVTVDGKVILGKLMQKPNASRPKVVNCEPVSKVTRFKRVQPENA
jgi:hypothetical protein